MFVLISFDDIASAAGGFLKIFIGIGILGLTIGPLFTENAIAIPSLIFAIAVAAIISTILMIIEAVIDMKKEKDEIIKAKRKRTLICVILATLILSILGFIIPIKIWRITIKGFASMALLPFFFNIVFTFLLHKLYIEKKVDVKNCFTIIWDFIKNRILGQLIPITLICLFVMGVIEMMVLGEFVTGDTANKISNMFEARNRIATYYNDEFDSARNGKSIETIAQEKLDSVMDLLNDEREFQKLSDDVSISESDLRELNKFTEIYINQKDRMKDFEEKYGINIHFRGQDYESEEHKQFYVLELYDIAYGKTFYYKFDFNTRKIGEKFENKKESEKYCTELKRQEYEDKFGK